MVSDQKLNAERYKGLVIADVPGEIDLVRHAAVVGDVSGKRHMRAGDVSQSWSACE